MSRTIPYYTNTIVPQSIAKGENVLISSSENALRGLLMHLMEIPPDRIQDVQVRLSRCLMYAYTVCMYVLMYVCIYSMYICMYIYTVYTVCMYVYVYM